MEIQGDLLGLAGTLEGGRDHKGTLEASTRPELSVSLAGLGFCSEVERCALRSAGSRLDGVLLDLSELEEHGPLGAQAASPTARIAKAARAAADRAKPMGKVISDALATLPEALGLTEEVPQRERPTGAAPPATGAAPKRPVIKITPAPKARGRPPVKAAVKPRVPREPSTLADTLARKTIGPAWAQENPEPAPVTVVAEPVAVPVAEPERAGPPRGATPAPREGTMPPPLALALERPFEDKSLGGDGRRRFRRVLSGVRAGILVIEAGDPSGAADLQRACEILREALGRSIDMDDDPLREELDDAELTLAQLVTGGEG